MTSAGTVTSEPVFLYDFFDRAAQKWPDAIAIDVPPGVSRSERLLVTYSELKLRTNLLAHRLQASITQDAVVAILLPRDSEHLYISQLSALKAGAAYVCIDPSFPDEQVREILNDSQPVALLTNAAGVSRVSQSQFPIDNCIDVLEPMPQEDVTIHAPSRLKSTSLAYIIYTSGTTGRPKGVMISHQSVANLVRSDIDEFGLTPQDRVAQGSSAAYDSSVEEIWLALASGAAVVVMDDQTVRLGPDLVAWLKHERITVLCPPPTLLRATGCRNPEAELPDLRLLYVGGEALPRDVADSWSLGRRLVNGYGPTECTVTALRTDIYCGAPISIGMPVPGLNAWVLDDLLQPVEDGASGELCIAGIGLAAGYRNRPELNSEKFPVHPSLGRIYRTGDLVYRTVDGTFFYQGRIDSQVKLRGYRIELEAIESCLAACEGVREAACRVQGVGAQEALAAYIVPTDPDEPPSFEFLKLSLQKALPHYMVPSLFGILSELPMSVGGKLKRNALPEIQGRDNNGQRTVISPRNAIETKLASAVRDTLCLEYSVSITDDFFDDLGGSSLQAAMLISNLRDNAETSSLTVRDVYEARTVEELAKRTRTATVAVQPRERSAETSAARLWGATLVQTLWLLLELLAVTYTSYLSLFYIYPKVINAVNPVLLILLAPFLLFGGLVVYTPVSIITAVIIKKALIGKYRPQKSPVWGSFYIRNWVMQQVVRIIPWQLLECTEFQIMALRALGARIGDRVHIHRGVDLLQGGWDLLDIGDDVTVSQDAAIRLIDLEDGYIVAGRVSLGSGSTLEVRAGLAPDTCMEEKSTLNALSFLPSGQRIPYGERWDGIPAEPAGHTPDMPCITDTRRSLSPMAHSILSVLSSLLLWSILGLPLELVTIGCYLRFGLDTNMLVNAMHDISLMLGLIALMIAPLPMTVALEALIARLLGPVPEGVISRWSIDYIRVKLKANLVESAGIWLSGAMFWPVWLRWAGMKVGANCEISTIIDVMPELVEIGPEVFLADGIYLGGPIIRQGTVTLAKTSLEKNTFLGNHVVIPNGQRLPEDILLGVCTVANERVMRRGSSWFGHPPFELPHREIVECDRSLTHSPSLIRYITRLFWECLRFTLPVVPIVLLTGLYQTVAQAEVSLSTPQMIAVLPAIFFIFAALPCLLILTLKWGLLGRVQPGTHPLWSCWCSRWDFLYVAWGVYARGLLSALEGTQMLIWYLRAVGMKLGKRVVLGRGFSQVVDPDMLEIDDDATVSAMFQAHTFEDRVLKIDRVYIGKHATLGEATVPLYGADIGENTYVYPHSVIMKRERLLPGLHYAGAPTRVIDTSHGAIPELPISAETGDNDNVLVAGVSSGS